MKAVYLTIDDGPSEDFKNKINYLSSKGIPAILFCIGNLIEKSPESIIYAIKKGFVIGNHSYNHPKFSEISISEAEMQISKTDKLIQEQYEKASIKRPAKLFRFPHGDKGNEETKPKYQEILKKLGYKQPKFENINYNWFNNSNLDKDTDTYWTYNSKDYTVKRYREMGDKSPYGFSDPSMIFKRIDENSPEDGKGLNFSDSNDIFLIHDHKLTSDLFNEIINKVIKKNIQFKLPVLS